MVYYVLMQPLNTYYEIAFWGSAYQTNINKLETILIFD